MSFQSLGTLVLAAVALIAAAPPAAAAPAQPPAAKASVSDALIPTDDGVPGVWLNGAAGFESALKEHRQTNKPMLIYVYTDWCPYCRKFNSTVLPDPRVQQCLAGFARVKYNPEWSPRESRLAEDMRIGGYPTLLTRNRDDIMLRPVKTQVSPDEFLKICRAELEKAKR